MFRLPARLVRSIEDQGADLGLLVVRLGALGDLLRTLPAVRLLRRGLPSSRIHWVMDDRWCPLFRGHQDVDGIVALPRSSWRSRVRSPSRWPSLLFDLGEFRRRLRSIRADLAIDFHGNLRSGLVTLASGAGVRLGHAGHQQKEGNRLFTTHRVPAGDRRTSRIDRNLALVRALGLPDRPLPTAGLAVPESAHAVASRIAWENFGASPYAAVVPGSSKAQIYKRPPSRLLAEACRALAERGIGALLLYGPGEEDAASAVERECRGLARLAPPTDLWVLAALLGRARLFVGGDTGPMHLACAMGCPVVAIYGPTDPKVNSPWGVPFRTVQPQRIRYTGVKRRDRCGPGFEALPDSSVRAAVEDLLDPSKVPDEES